MKQSRPFRRRRIAVAAAFGVAIWVAAFVWGSHSEGFHYAEGRIRASQAIQSLVGNVRTVTMPVFGHYREKFVGSDKWVNLIVDVNGDKGGVRLRMALRKNNGIWTITESYVGGQKIDLH